MKNLILVVGASGAGKDTLLKEARFHYKINPKIHFIRRYITRKPGEFEENYYIDDLAFEILKDQGFFISYWYAHHLKYGIPKQEIEHLKEDETAVISISREKIGEFESRYGRTVTTIHVTADRSIIEERLKKRKRESYLEIETRLQRIETLVVSRKLIHFDNNQELNISSKAFIALLNRIINNC